ncbi:MAG: leucine-rich repeat protein [Bacilli bacterium]
MNKNILFLLLILFVLFGCSKKDEIAITYISDNEIIKEASLEENELFTPKKQGYNFGGWYYDKEFLNRYSLDDKIEDKTTLFAKWIKSSNLDLFKYRVINNDEIEITEFFSAKNTNDRVVIPQYIQDKPVTSITNIFEDVDNIIRVTLPYGLKKIGDRAFAGMISLETINIPNTIEAIGEYAFSNTKSLKQIIIPDSVKSLGINMFDGSGIVKAFLEDGITYIPNSMFRKCEELVYVDIPNTVNSIGQSAFQGCVALYRINIPEGVTVIEPNTFEWCWKLSILELPNSLTMIDTYAFANCDSLKTIIIPKGVHTIRTRAFARSTADEIFLPVGIVTMESNIFLRTGYLRVYYEGYQLPNNWDPDWISQFNIEDIEYGIYFLS